MKAQVAIAPILLVLVVAAAVVLLARRRPVLTGRRPRKRRLLTRLICAALAAAILIAVAAGTWRQVRQCYAGAGAAEKIAVRVPARPAPSRAGRPSERIDKARLLLHLLVVDAFGGQQRIPQVKAFEVRWPQMRGQAQRFRCEVGGVQLDCRLELRELYWAPATDGEAGFHANGSLQVRWRRTVAGRGSVGRSGRFGSREHVFDLARHLPAVPANPLSVVSGRRADLHVLLLGAMLAKDDPLKEIGVAEFGRMRRDDLADLLKGNLRAGKPPPRPRRAETPFAAIALAEHIGLSALLLLAAAALLAQVFARRGLAFAGMLAGVILYAAALDRLALSAHLSRLGDAGAPTATRMIGCSQAAETFFYRHSAARAIGAAARDAAAPAALRQHAETTAALMARQE